VRSTPFEIYLASLPIRLQKSDALDLVESRAFPKGITLQVYRPAEHPRYATDAG